MSVALKPLFRNSERKAYCPELSTNVIGVINNCTFTAVRKFIKAANLDFLCAFYHCIPRVAFRAHLMKEHKFLFATGSALDSVTAASSYPAVVKNHQCTRFNKRRKILHHFMFNKSRFSSQKHQTVFAAFSRRFLRYKFLWQIKIKVAGFHCFYFPFPEQFRDVHMLFP